MSVEGASSNWLQVVLFQPLERGDAGEAENLEGLSSPVWRGFATVLKGMYERYVEQRPNRLPPEHTEGTEETPSAGLQPYTLCSCATVRSLTTLPVFRVEAGSNSRNQHSSSATGLCSTPRGTTTNSPSSIHS